MSVFVPTHAQSRAYFEDRLGVRLSSRDQMSVKCPFHADRKPSMSLNLVKGAWKCHACDIGGGILDFERQLTGKPDAECWEAINRTIGRDAHVSSQSGQKRIVATYDYQDANDKLLYQAIRYEHKGFSQRRPDGEVGWIWDMKGVERVPFNLPLLVRANVVLIAEGEKDASRLQGAATDFPNDNGTLVYAATTNIGGAGKWLDSYSPYLSGKMVYVFPDNDTVGRDHARKVCASVHKYAHKVHLVDLQGLPDKGDISDYLANHTSDDVFKAMKSAPAWHPSTANVPADSSETANALGLKLKRGSDIVEKEQAWLVNNFIPADTLVIVAGPPGIGKTTACLALAAAISRGELPIIGGRCEPRNVLMLTNEDSESHTSRNFKRLGGCIDRLYVEDEDTDLQWTMEKHSALEAQIVRLNPTVVIIDSLTTHKPGAVNLNSHGEVAPMLVGLRKLAAAQGCVIICIHHTNKSQTDDPVAKVSGSIGIVATARNVLLVGVDPTDSDLRVAVVSKINLGPKGLGYRFRLDPFRWEGPTEMSAEDLLQGSGRAGGKRDWGVEFLRDALKGGRAESSSLASRANSEFGITRRTLQRAAERLEVVKTMSGFGAARRTYWSLPIVIDDTMDDNTEDAVVDGPESMEMPHSIDTSAIDDNHSHPVVDVSSMETDPMFETEV